MSTFFALCSLDNLVVSSDDDDGSFETCKLPYPVALSKLSYTFLNI